MYIPTSLNSWLIILIGLGFFFGGLYHFIYYYDRIFSFGLVITGIGFTLFGYTDGFKDPTPRGMLLYRIGIISFMIGVPIVAYGAYQMARFGF